MSKTLNIIFIILIIIGIVSSSGCVSIHKSKPNAYSVTVTTNTTLTTTSFTTIEMMTTTTTTVTLSITKTDTIINHTSTTRSTTYTTTMTKYLNNVTYITRTKIITFYYGDDGKPNIVYYIPSPISTIFADVSISKTTVYYPSSLKNLYTPILPVFIFYDKKYYVSLVEQLHISPSNLPTAPDDALAAATIMNFLTKKVVLVSTMSYPTFINVAISKGSLNPIEEANYFIGLGVLQAQTPTIVYISNITFSTVGAILPNFIIIGTRMFGNTLAMNAYYYNLMHQHINYYGIINPHHPGLTIESRTITDAPVLIGYNMIRTSVSYVITISESYNVINTFFTITGVWESTWGSYTKTDALGNTVTAYVSEGEIYIITNTFTTNTTTAGLYQIYENFLPRALRGNNVYYINPTSRQTILLEDIDPVYGVWLIITINDHNIIGTFINSTGASIGCYSGSITILP